CCQENKVSEFCSSKMCAVETSPNAFATVSIATTCRSEWPKVSPCLADGRNHTECCRRKGVQNDCLPICAGSTESLGVHSVLCLNLDLQAIYQCLREGYESHPSPPVNVSVNSVSESSAEITWAEPDSNAHLVETYTLLIRKVEHGARVHNAVSPHTEIGLDPDNDMNKWVQCASEGRDHSRCCEKEDVPKECLTGCRHPFQVADVCFHSLSKLSTCFSAPHVGTPSAVRRLKVTEVTPNSALLSWEDADYGVTGYKVEASNDHGVSWVAEEVEADSSIDTVTCAVTDTDGRQNVAMRHLLVKFGPVAKMDKEKVRAFDDQSADISCTVKGFPSPAIRFEIDGRAAEGETRVKVVAMNTYKATLHLRNTKGKAGVYSCIAEKDGSHSVDTAELVISRELLPVNPRLILSCCEDEHIEGDCLQACSIGKTPPSVGNCSQYAASLLKCATDFIDHSDCCTLQGVSSKCLPLCSGDSFSTDVDCTPYAVTIMECFVRGHEGSPQPVRNVEYEVIGRGLLKVKWEDTDVGDTYRYYAVYYKKRDEEGEYK
ncbi:DB module, partial [Teladorsagia circumcincta]